jgi:hypothetical protein
MFVGRVTVECTCIVGFMASMVYYRNRCMWFSHCYCAFRVVCPNHPMSSIFNLIRYSIFDKIEFSLALKILLPSPSGDYLALCIEYIRLKVPQKHKNWLVANSCFCLLFIFNSTFLGLGWAESIDHGLLLSAWVRYPFTRGCARLRDQILSTILTLFTLRNIIQQRVQNYFRLDQGHGNDNYSAGRISEKFDVNLYTPIRLYNLKLDLPRMGELVYFLDSLEPLELQKKSSKSCEDPELLDGRQLLNRLVNITIISLLELQDESFELAVLTTYIPRLKVLLGTLFLDYSVDWEHRPFDPSVTAVESFCAAHPELSNSHIKARSRMIDLFLRRAEAMIEDGFPMHKDWYSHLVELISK